MSNSGRRRLVAAREALQGAIEDEAFCRTVTQGRCRRAVRRSSLATAAAPPMRSISPEAVRINSRKLVRSRKVE
jgi:hypothetical protein